MPIGIGVPATGSITERGCGATCVANLVLIPVSHRCTYTSRGTTKWENRDEDATPSPAPRPAAPLRLSKARARTSGGSPTSSRPLPPQGCDSMPARRPRQRVRLRPARNTVRRYDADRSRSHSTGRNTSLRPAFAQRSRPWVGDGVLAVTCDSTCRASCPTAVTIAASSSGRGSGSMWIRSPSACASLVTAEYSRACASARRHAWREPASANGSARVASCAAR